MIKETQIIPLTIEGYGSDGAGIARIDGLVVFVKGGIRGEVCNTYIDKVGRSAIWGHVTQVETPSPARISPDCTWYGDCGGCQLRHMTYAEELEMKRQRVQDALQRIGGVDTPVAEILGAENPDRYRNKAQFPVAPQNKIGFYRTRTHQVIDVDDCLLQSEATANLRTAAKAWMEQFHISAYEERSGKGLVRHVYVRKNQQGQTLFCLLVNGKKVPNEAELVAILRRADPNLVGVVLGVNRSKSNVILGDSYRTLWGQDFLMDTLCGLSFELSVPSFYQINPPQTEVLYGKALEFAGLTGDETVMDLYCGIGTISLAMSKSAHKVYGVEVVPQAIENAKENARRNGITNAEFFCADAGDAASKLAAKGVRPEVICVDPPRKGLAPEVVATVVQMAPDRVVYVSCDPATLARDVARFKELGYHTQKAVAVDMFPRTAHVESVVLLTHTNNQQD